MSNKYANWKSLAAAGVIASAAKQSPVLKQLSFIDMLSLKM